MPLVRPGMIEMTAFGAARLAAVTLGLWTTPPREGAGVIRFRPSISRTEREAFRSRWREAVARVRTRRGK
jgi:glycerol kinase